jgi:predicted deacetylase
MKAVSLVLHDVSPITLRACQRIAHTVAQLSASAPLTLLVVPNHHRRATVRDDAEFRRWIDERLERGDEIALHGYYHQDEASPPRTLPSWFARRVLTSGEGEFAALDVKSAHELIERGLNELAACGWTPIGFVPPAWQMPHALRFLLAGFPLQYTSSHTALFRLPTLERYPISTLGFSARSAWRRSASIAVNRIQLRTRAPDALLRVALHPIDSAHPPMMEEWSRSIRSLLDEREPVTKSELLDRAELAEAPRISLANHSNSPTTSGKISKSTR